MLVDLVFTLDDFLFLTFVGNFVAVAGLVTLDRSPGKTTRIEIIQQRIDGGL